MGRRCAASLIDLVLLLGAYPLLQGVARLAFFARQPQWAFLGAEVVVLTALYYAGLEASRMEGSLGKHLLGLRVLDRQQQPLSLARALLRHTLRLLTLPFGWLGLVLTSRRLAVHDLLTASLVMAQSDQGPVQSPTRAHCAKPLAKKCSGCAVPLDDDAHFCHQCGTAVAVS